MSNLQQLTQTGITRPVKLRLDELYRSNLGFVNPFTNLTYENPLIGLTYGLGVLAGHVATIDPLTNEYIVCTQPDQIALGLFGITSSKEITGRRYSDDIRMSTLVINSFHSINTYEYFSFYNINQILVYKAGDLLYCSPFGLLTKELSNINGGRPVAIVEAPPLDEYSAMTIRICDFASSSGLSHNPLTIGQESLPYAYVDQDQVFNLNVNNGPDSLVTVDHSHTIQDIDGLQAAINSIYNYINNELGNLNIDDIEGLRDELDELRNLIGDNDNSDCCDALWAVVNKLMPKAPLGISYLVTEPDFDWVEARYIGTGEKLQRVTLNRSPGFILENLYNGLNGDLTSYLTYNNGASTLTGSLDLSQSGTISNGHLDLSAQRDFYLGESGKEDFHYVRDGVLKPTSNLPIVLNNKNKYNYLLTHTDPQENYSNFGDTYIDQLPSDPVLVEPNLTRLNGINTSNIRYVSGVPYLGEGSTILGQANIKNAVSNFYHKDSVILYSGEGINSGEQLPLAPPIAHGSDVFFPNLSFVVGDNQYTEDLEIEIQGRDAYDNRDSLVINYTTPIRIDTISDESDRVYSGFDELPIFGLNDSEYGRPFDPNQSLLLNEELQMEGGRIFYPYKNYNSSLPLNGPDYSNLTGMRWYTIKIEDFEGTGANLNFQNTLGNWNGQEPTQGMKIYIRVDGERATFGWVNGYLPYSGVGAITNSNTGGLVKDSDTTNTLKGITFGEGDSRKGTLYVRVGMLETDDKSWTNILVTPRI